MRTTAGLLLAAILSHSAPALSGGCDPSFTNSLGVAQRFVDSVRVDKPGLARVYAADGSEFTAGQLLWMRGQLREVQGSCSRGQLREASERLADVRRLIDAHAPNAR